MALPTGLVRVGLRVFGRLPGPLRVWAVRLGTPTHLVGSMCLILHDGRILLVRQSYRSGWGAPGGLLDRGEVPEAAAVREAAEEVGLAIAIDGPGVVFVDPKVRRVDISFRCSVAPGNAPEDARPASPEIVETRWFALDALPDPLQPDTARALRGIGVAARFSPSPRRRRRGAPSGHRGDEAW